MKEKSKLTIAVTHYKILDYLSTKKSAQWNEMNNYFKLDGCGTYFKQLEEKKFIEKISRGTYKITKLGKRQLKILKEL